MTNWLQKGFTIFDGGMGTMLEGKVPDGKIPCELNLIDAKVIADVHRQYIDAGAHIITTNSFEATGLTLKAHGLDNLTEEINRAAVRIARSAAGDKVKIAGELGPTSLLPTLGNIGFEDMAASYCEQATYLLEEGVDFIRTSTSQDILQIKAAIVGVKDAMAKVGREVPIFASATFEKNGAMLLGTTIGAFLATIAPYEPAAIGLNCSTGPDEMAVHLKQLCESSPFPVLCIPNAGLPQMTDEGTKFPQGPDEFAQKLAKLAVENGVECLGGCCGTTPTHIKALSDALQGKKRPNRKPNFKPSLASLFSAIPFDQEPRPLLFAEQTNVSGSRKFKTLIENEDYEGAVEFAKKKAQGTHGLDINLSSTTEDEIDSFNKLLPPLVKVVDSAIMIDSTSLEAIANALPLIPGRPIVNSINLEGSAKKAKEVLKVAKRYGAAVVGLTIDDEGMAKTVSRKVEVAKKIIDVIEAEGFTSDDLLIDSLTFPVASGKDMETAARETLDAVKKINSFARTSLGITNSSYGLPKGTRPALTTLFFNAALDKGLSAAIISPLKLVPIQDIPKKLKDAAKKIFSGDPSGLAPYLEETEVISSKKSVESLPPREKLHHAIMTGQRSDLESTIATLVENTKPKEIIDTILLPAMGEVGELFGNGKMALPFVLEAAETMRKAIDLLEPYMTEKATQRGTIVLATVRGDIHDIGKNLVDIILSNNGYKVINLGVKQPIDAVWEAVKENNADAIGLSALLTTSAKSLAEDMPYLKKMEAKIPVLVGGAALNQKFVDKISKDYENIVYCPNAIAGLKAMEKVTGNK